jgi:hypothetical protein
MKKIVVAPKEVLLTIGFIWGLSKSLRDLGLSRRKTPDWLAEVIFGWIENGGVILDEDGVELIIYPGIIGDAHGEDGSFAWIAEQKRRAEEPPRRRPRSSLLLRLQLYEIAFRLIERPVVIE